MLRVPPLLLGPVYRLQDQEGLPRAASEFQEDGSAIVRLSVDPSQVDVLSESIGNLSRGGMQLEFASRD